MQLIIAITNNRLPMRIEEYDEGASFMSEQSKPNESRRQLLKNIGLGMAASAVAAGTTTAAHAAVDKQDDSKKETQTTGYHETQHIRDYYETL